MRMIGPIEHSSSSSIEAEDQERGGK